MQFYENYVRLCNIAGKKPTALAEELGITRATASRWSRGQVPSYPNLIKLADFFGIGVGELVGATPENVADLAKYFSVYCTNAQRKKPQYGKKYGKKEDPM